MAYIHVMHGPDIRLAPLSAKEADAICTELGKQAKGAAAPMPDLTGRIASQPAAIGESPPPFRGEGPSPAGPRSGSEPQIDIAEVQ